MRSGRWLAVLFAAVGNNSTANEINCAHTDNCMEAPRRRCGMEMKYIAHTPRCPRVFILFRLFFLYVYVRRRRPKAIGMFVTLQCVREFPFSAAVQIFMWLRTHTHTPKYTQTLRRVMRKYYAYALYAH